MENQRKKNLGRNKLLRAFINLRNRFDLEDGKEDESETIEYISKNVEFRGANLWILIFAIFVASIGLNVNSTAVIIGAMLISPLMGPIMGIGLAAGINDFELLKRSFRNLSTAVFISILTSSIYFFITPIHDVQSELLARTEPTVWDVLIALFGGLAGIVAGSRKEKSNAIPGVAIATALMPPLCTAGYGIATGNLYFFLGAFYLFFINSVFISLSTYIIVRFMKYPKKIFLDPKKERKVQSYITFFTLLTLLPSIYLAYGIVKKSIWNQKARDFVQLEFQFPRTQVLSSDYLFNKSGRIIEVSLIGDRISADQISILENKIKSFGLEETQLIVNQSGNGTDIKVLTNDILKDLYERNEGLIKDKDNRILFLEKELAEETYTNYLGREIVAEAKINYPTLSKFSFGKTVFNDVKNQKLDTMYVAYAFFEPNPSEKELKKFRNWLQVRIKTDTVALFLN
jgi:uncharacterized hydrophobic protein (TIGR00271 family)